MEGDPPMTGQPGLDRWGLVGGHVVEHHVEVALRVGAGDVAQERQEVGACYRQVTIGMRRDRATAYTIMTT